jgi:hypothetical protein
MNKTLLSGFALAALLASGGVLADEAKATLGATLGTAPAAGVQTQTQTGLGLGQALKDTTGAVKGTAQAGVDSAKAGVQTSVDSAKTGAEATTSAAKEHVHKAKTRAASAKADAQAKVDATATGAAATANGAVSNALPSASVDAQVNAGGTPK